MARTYARARLWTGVLGVGTVVTAATAMLVTGLPQRLFGGAAGGEGAAGAAAGLLASDALTLAACFAVAALAMLPFDVAGGLLLPRRHGRPAPTAARFAVSWLRGVTVLGAVWTLAGLAVLAAGRAGGRPAAVAAIAGLALALLLLQEPLARLVGGLRRAASGPEPGVLLLRGSDPGFTGGFAGLRGTLVVPEHWTRALDPEVLGLLLERRRRIHRSGAWAASVALAVAWNAGGFALASLLPGAGVTTLAGLLTAALGFTLWTFLGLLLLPTVSRRATRAADAAVAVDAASRARLEDAVAALDELQDGEPERAPAVEGVFHPVPSAGNRLRALSGAAQESGPALAPEGPPAVGAWHLARTALYLSWAGLSLLPRAVHCNAGRPELWAYLPTDG